MLFTLFNHHKVFDYCFFTHSLNSLTTIVRSVVVIPHALLIFNNMNHVKQWAVSSRLEAMPCCEPAQDWRPGVVTIESRLTRQAIDMILHGQKLLVTA